MLRSNSVEEVKYERMPKVLMRTTGTNRGSISLMDPNKRRTLMNQLVNKKKLETIGELSHTNPNQNTSLSEAETINRNNETVSQSHAYSTMRTSLLNKDYLRYEQAINRQPANWTLLSIAIATVLVRVFLWVPDSLIASFKVSKAQEYANLCKLYQSLSEHRVAMNLGYYTVLRSAAFAQGLLANNRWAPRDAGSS